MSFETAMIPIPRHLLWAAMAKLREAYGPDVAEGRALSEWETEHDVPGFLVMDPAEGLAD